MPTSLTWEGSKPKFIDKCNEVIHKVSHFTIFRFRYKFSTISSATQNGYCMLQTYWQTFQDSLDHIIRHNELTHQEHELLKTETTVIWYVTFQPNLPTKFKTNIAKYYKFCRSQPIVSTGSNHSHVSHTWKRAINSTR